MLLSWIVIAELELDAYQSIHENSHLAISQNPRFLKEIGISSARSYRPWALAPDITVWQEITRRINKDLGGKATGRSSILRLFEPGSDDSREYAFSLRLYRPNIISIEVRLKSDEAISLKDLFEYREFYNHKTAANAVDILIGILKSHSTVVYNTGNSSFARPVIFLPVDVVDGDFQGWREEHKDVLASLAINNKEYSSADPELADKIFDANKEVDIKYRKNAFSIINKQGIVTAFSSRTEGLGDHMMGEHEKKMRFLELALVMRILMSNFKRIREYRENLADFLYFLASPMTKPDATLSKSVNGTHIWRILSKELAFSGSIESVNQKTEAKIEEKFEYFSRMPEAAYDAFDFEQRADDYVKKYGKSWMDNAFDNKKWVFWLITSLIGICTFLLGKLVLK